MSESHAEHGHSEEHSNENVFKVIGNYISSVRNGVVNVLKGVGDDILVSSLKLPFRLVDQGLRDVWNITKGVGRGIKSIGKWLISPARSGGGGHGGHH